MRPGLILVRKHFLMGLYMGELIHGRAYTWESLYMGGLIHGRAYIVCTERGGALYIDCILC